ncbi:flagellar hook-length control protein FliK [Photobacterium minamisatsumaniensis]|uniref:flagellar hook-length control protein FliK n=1 Tax=Photobacterium minamisatsumaniensis TaxID=2910233 RepID=UPI003D124E2C
MLSSRLLTAEPIPSKGAVSPSAATTSKTVLPKNDTVEGKPAEFSEKLQGAVGTAADKPQASEKPLPSEKIASSTDTAIGEGSAKVVGGDDVKSSKHQQDSTSGNTEAARTAYQPEPKTVKAEHEIKNGDQAITAQSDVNSKPESKAQAMNEGEELLSRLTAANQQLNGHSPSEPISANNKAEIETYAQSEDVASLLAGNSLPPEKSHEFSVSQATHTPQMTTEQQGLTDDQLAQVFAQQPMDRTAIRSTDNIPQDSEASTNTDSIDAGNYGGDVAINGDKVLTDAAAIDKTIENKVVASGELAKHPEQTVRDIKTQTLTGTSATSAIPLASDVATGQQSANHVQAMATPMTAAVAAQTQNSGNEQAVTNAQMTADELVGKTLASAALAEQDQSGQEQSAQQTASTSTTSTQQLLQRVTEQAAVTPQSPLPLNKEQASEQLAERMQMMLSKNLKHVDIRLDPPELGKLQIKLSMNNDQATVQFTVGNQQTRDLVEQAMPRLRELLSQQGLQLTQSSVQQDGSRQFTGQQNPQGQQTGNDSNGQRSANQIGSDDDFQGVEANELWVSQPKDGVDYYA